MKAYYVSDLHGDFEGLEKWTDYVKSQNPDFVFVSGDLVDTAFAHRSEEYKAGYADSFNALYNIKQNISYEGSLEELAKEIKGIESEKPEIEELKTKSESYLDAVKEAETGLREQYGTLKEILSGLGSQYFVIPGNYDSDKILEEILDDSHIHKKTCETENGVKLSGYGGADVYAMNKIPPEHIVNYDSHEKVYSFFRKENPDIAVVHNPPFGACDFVRTSNLEKGKDNIHAGSPGLAAYVREKRPKIVLSGHMHGDYGVQKLGRSYVVNPGRFGRGAQGAGTFYELEIDDNTGNLVSAEMYRINLETGEIEKLDSAKEGKPLSMEVYKPQASEEPESLEDRIGEQAGQEPAQSATYTQKPEYDLSGIPSQIKSKIKALESKLKGYSRIPAYGRKLGVIEGMIHDMEGGNLFKERTCDVISRGKRLGHDVEVINLLTGIEKDIYKLSEKHPELEAYSKKADALFKMFKDSDPKQGREQQIAHAYSFLNEFQSAVAGAYSG